MGYHMSLMVLYLVYLGREITQNHWNQKEFLVEPYFLGGKKPLSSNNNHLGIIT